MKNKLKMLSLVIAGLMFTAPSFAVAESQSTVTTDEFSTHLILMREEEKIARDVYRVLYEQTGIRAFANITQSEQRHMDAMAQQLARFNLIDPIVDDTTGVFANPKFQDMFTALIEKGQGSDLEALYVAAYIEELDIKDLIEAIAETEDTQLKNVYGNLLRGSRNHLRAFVRQISKRGDSYRAQLLAQEAVDVILATAQERWQGGGRGMNGGGRGQGKNFND